MRSLFRRKLNIGTILSQEIHEGLEEVGISFSSSRNGGHQSVK